MDFWVDCPQSRWDEKSHSNSVLGPYMMMAYVMQSMWGLGGRGHVTYGGTDGQGRSIEDIWTVPYVSHCLATI